MQKHVTLVGALHIGYSAFQLVMALMVFIFLVGGGLIGGFASQEEIVFAATFVVGAIICLWILMVSLPGIIGGVALLRHKTWGRYMVLVLSVLALLNIPLGTALGVYSIWVLVNEETAKLFGPCC